MVVDHGAVPLLINLLKSKSCVRESAILALGNIGWDGPWARDLVLEGGALPLLLECIPGATISTLRAVAGTLHACCCNTPLPAFERVCA